jgi:hypothetical protein
VTTIDARCSPSQIDRTDWHSHVYLEDIGPEAFENIGMEQLMRVGPFSALPTRQLIIGSSKAKMKPTTTPTRSTSGLSRSRPEHIFKQQRQQQSGLELLPSCCEQDR